MPSTFRSFLLGGVSRLGVLCGDLSWNWVRRVTEGYYLPPGTYANGEEASWPPPPVPFVRQRLRLLRAGHEDWWRIPAASSR